MKNNYNKINIITTVGLIIVAIIITAYVVSDNTKNISNSSGAAEADYLNLQHYRADIERQAMLKIAEDYNITINRDDLESLADDIINENKSLFGDDLLRDPETTVKIMGRESFVRSFEIFYIQDKLTEILSEGIYPTEEELKTILEVYTDTLLAQGISDEDEIKETVIRLYKEDKVYSDIEDIKLEYQNKIIRSLLGNQ